MRVLITGAAGLFGHGLARVLAERHEVAAVTRAEADITDASLVRACLRMRRPQVVIHAAAIPDLDACEEDPAKARCVNVEGTRNIAEAARAERAAVALISTDAVFDGRKNAPYTEDDPVNPPTVYGRTKVDAERIVADLPAHWIVRVSVLFGPRPPGNNKPDFVESGLQRLAAGQEYIVAADQMGSALYTLDGARAIEQLIMAGAFGLYHVANQGPCTRFDLARRAAAIAGLAPRLVVGKPMAEMGRRAQRLPYSVMALDKLARAGVPPPRPWPEALADYIASLRPL